jgi:two-component system, LuxR family, response regulator FixJ
MSVQKRAVVHVVDDDEAVRESLEAVLLVSGLDVNTYVSAEDFLARATDDGGCLILDVNMPGMSGLDLLDRLARTGRHRPVVILTARRDDGLRELASSLGASSVLSKPVRKDELLGAIAAAEQSYLDDGRV